jgi:hypothetical protein
MTPTYQNCYNLHDEGCKNYESNELALWSSPSGVYSRSERLAQLGKKSPTIYGSIFSLSSSQEPANVSYTEPEVFSPQLHIYFL